MGGGAAKKTTLTLDGEIHIIRQQERLSTFEILLNVLTHCLKAPPAGMFPVQNTNHTWPDTVITKI